MRHHVEGRKLGRTSSHRRALFSNMATSLILKDRIETTLPKAKELRSIADRLVTMGKKGTVHARRRAFSIIHSREAVQKLFSDLAGRFAKRHGGYTRILKLGNRHGDAAPMAVIEYLPPEGIARHGEKDVKKVQETAKPKKAKEKKAETVHSKEKQLDAKPVVEKSKVKRGFFRRKQTEK